MIGLRRLGWRYFGLATLGSHLLQTITQSCDLTTRRLSPAIGATLKCYQGHVKCSPRLGIGA